MTTPPTSPPDSAPLRQRARSGAHKALRRDALIDAATQAFLTQRYESVTMQSVADACGLSKASVFVYFPTKEALFLAMAEREIAGFFTALIADLETDVAPGGAALLTLALDRAYARSPALVRLLGVLHGVLESRLDPEQSGAFRLRLLPGIERAGRAVETHLPFLPPGAGRTVVLAIHCIALGVQQLAEVAWVQAVPAESPGADLFRVDFPSMFRPLVGAYLRGLQCTAPACCPSPDPRTLP